MATDDQSPPLTLGACASLALTWEATAAKPGNVYRGADFDDCTFADFITAAAVVGPVIDRAPRAAVGATVLEAIEATRAAVATNTNLGAVLLIAPLAAVEPHIPLASGVAEVLDRLTPEDAALVYAAIRHAVPGGLGKVDAADVHAATPPQIPLRDAMALAADRDLVARQYVNNFADVFETADRIARHADAGTSLHDAIVAAFVELLAKQPDSLIQRKCGPAVAQEAAARAAAVLEARPLGDDDWRHRLADLDFWLRADGRRRNPGTTADLIAAALFVLLRDRRLHWPIRFY